MAETTLRRRVHDILEVQAAGDRVASAVNTLLFGLIFLNLGAVALESVPDYYPHYQIWFRLFECVSLALFLLEYGLRVWSSVEDAPFARRGTWRGRWRFMRGAPSLIDLLALLPLAIRVAGGGQDHALELSRLLMMLRFGRFSPGLASLGRVVYEERRGLWAAAVIALGMMMAGATIMYQLEHQAQPEKFSSIPAAMWWSIATLTTIGYGDVVPVTALGRMVGSVMMFFGVGIFALPLGLMASGFAKEIQRQEFVVTWGMVARVPLFADLHAVTIADIARLLRSRAAPAGGWIARKGEAADCMYLIVSGKVRIDLPHQAVYLQDGDFFGEIGLLRAGLRSANVRAVTQCKLLVLSASDFEHFIEMHPELRERIEQVARDRLAEQQVGEFLEPELHHHPEEL